MNRLLEKTFENRGYASDFLDDILTCNHSIPFGTDILCNYLDSYRQSQDLIVLLTDFDFDGICSGVIGLAGLAELGFNVALYLPDVSKGYGFDKDTIDDLIAKYPDVKCIMTGDVGISAYDGITYAKSLGLSVFVTDHHKEPKNKVQVAADVVVDPNRKVDTLSYANICGANVMYQILRYYAEYHMPNDCGHYMSQIDRLRVFAGFGTISDSMPLYYENRPMVMDAIHICRMVYGDGSSQMADMIDGCDIYRRVFVGLRELFLMYADAGKISRNADITEDFIGYYIAPMFNSIKRLNGDIFHAYNVFFGGVTNAKDSLLYLFDLNEQRKQLVQQKFAEMFLTNQPWAPYVYLTDAISGICGLLAQKVMSITGMPSFVVHSNLDKNDENAYSGSGRCPSWFPFLDVGMFPNCGWVAAGHNPAFGFGCLDDDAMDRLVVFLQKQISRLKPSDEELEFRPDFVISEFNDGDADLDILLLSDYVHSLNLCRPFGAGFPEPVCEFRFSPKNVTWSVIGSDKSHLKLTFANGVTVLCFNQAVKIGALIDKKTGNANVDELPDKIIMHGKWSFNEFNDVRTLQFMGDIVNLGDEYELQEEQSVG